MRRSFLQFAKDRVTNTLRIASEMGIPETQFFDALSGEKHCPFGIMLLLLRMTVTRAIDFDGKPGFFAKEIQLVRAHRMLSAKLTTGETPVSQPTPQELFSPCFSLAKLSRSRAVGHERSVRNGNENENLFFCSSSPWPSPPRRGNAIRALWFFERWFGKSSGPLFSEGRPTIHRLLGGEGRGEDEHP